MKTNKLVLAAVLFSTLTLVSCGGDNYTVKFKYNHKSNKGVYQQVELQKDDVLNEPAEPNIEDYVFEGWYSDSGCKKPYLRFGLQIDSSFSLYAKWSEYANLSQVEKIERFQKAIANYSYNAYHIVEEVNAEVGYPGVVAGDDGIFYVHDKMDYRRYQDITTVDYYSIDADSNETLYGKRQFYYDDQRFYNIYVDLEDPTQSEDPITARYDESQVEPFLSLDYVNINGRHEKSMIDCYNNPQFTEETFTCEFDFNYTKLNKELETYSYTESYFYAIYSESIGNYASYQFAIEYGLIIRNGLIRSSNINTISYLAIGQDDVMQYVIENKVTDYYYNNGEYEAFEGERLPYQPAN